jgi:DNA-binding IclR family transcriptional regulator
MSDISSPGNPGRSGGMAVITKTGALLDVLARSGELSAAAIADRLGEPRPSIYRLLASLQDVGWVERGSQRGPYRLGLKLIGLATSVADRLDVRRLALAVMERLHEDTGETVFLCLRREWRAVCVERIDGARVQSLALRVGESLPLHAGAAPRVLLAFEPVHVWHGYVGSGELEPFTERTPVEPAALFQTLELARAEGVAVSDGDVTVGIGAIGAPIFDHRGHVAAALSISGLRERVLSDEHVRQLVIDGSAEISSALGYSHRERTDLRATH